MEAKWIEWVRRLQAIAQNGLMFSKDPFDRERYEQVRSVAAEILARCRLFDLQPCARPQKSQDREAGAVPGRPAGGQDVVRTCAVIAQYLRGICTYEETAAVAEP